MKNKDALELVKTLVVFVVCAVAALVGTLAETRKQKQKR